MEATPANPHLESDSRLWRRMDLVAKWLWRLVLAFWALLLLTAVLLHVWIVPRLGDWKDDLARWAGEQTGLQVKIAGLEVVSHVLWASVDLKGVSFTNQQGLEVLSLDQASFTFSARSAMSLGVHHLNLEGLSVEWGRNGQGQWTVAGLPLKAQGAGNHPVVDWIVKQPRIHLRQGKVIWRDHGQPPVDWLHAVDLDLTRSLFQHRMALQATPASVEMGQRFEAVGQFREPLLTGRSGDPSTWEGDIHFQASEWSMQAFASRWPWPLPVQIRSTAAVRAWVSVASAEIRRADVDLQTDRLELSWPSRSQALILNQIQGRVTYAQDKDKRSHSLATDDLRFVMPSGEPWPQTAMNLSWQVSADHQLTSLTGQASEVDLSVVSGLALGLELPQSQRQLIERLQLDGQLKGLSLSWKPTQPGQAPHWMVKASANQLKWQPVETGWKALPWLPGLSGASIEFSSQADVGQLSLKVNQGELMLPGLLAEPRVPLDTAQLGLVWRLSGDALAVDIQSAQLVNRDLKASGQGQWFRDASTSRAGRLQLGVDIQNALANRVHRYLPAALPTDAIRYVQQSVRSGFATQARIEVKGDLDRFPFAGSQDERFEIKAKLKDLTYAYVPEIKGSSGPPWPALVNLQGDLVIQGQSFSVRQASARVQGHPGMSWKSIEARISDLNAPVIEVAASGQGELQTFLSVVKLSPVSGLMQGVLNDTVGSGRASLDLNLRMPLDHLERTGVNGKLMLDKANIRLGESVPELGQITGEIQFSENRLIVPGLRAQALGGEARMEGGLAWVTPNPSDPRPLNLRVSGVATAAGLRNQRQIGWMPPLAESLEGSSRYDLVLGVRDGQPQWLITSTLVGMVLNLPAPFAKTANQNWPLRVEWRNMPASAPSTRAAVESTLSVNLGSLLKSQYLVRQLPTGLIEPIHGLVTVGSIEGSTFVTSSSGRQVIWQLNLPELEWEPWQRWFDRLQSVPSSIAPLTGVRSAAPASDAWGAWLPTQASLQAERLVATGRTWQGVQVRASRKGSAWEVDLKGADFQGSGQYIPVRGDLASELNFQFQRLVIPPSMASKVEEALSAEGAKQMPSLKVSVQSLILNNKPWGRVDLEATNRPLQRGAREWQLQRFDLSLPEAKFKAKGDWNPGRLTQQTRLDFTLDVADGGAFLNRLGMSGAVRSGQGKLAGHLGWQSSPMSPSLKTMSGQFNVNIEKGQFLKSEPGVGRFVGILSLQSLPRRLTLDFRDVFSQGFAFDHFRGDVTIEKGVARTNNLQMKGVSAGVFMDGWANVNDETHDIKAVVVPELNAGTASLFYSTINPLVGLTSFIAQYVLRQPLIKANTEHLRVYGTWSDPIVDTVDPETGKVLSSTRERSP